MRRLGTLVVLAALLSVPVAAGKSGGAAPIGLKPVRDGALLTHLDPASLRPVGRTLALGTHTQAWSFSTDRSQVVLSDEYGELVFVNTHSLRRLASVALPNGPNVLATAWVGGGRLVAIDENFDALDVTMLSPRRRVLHRRTLAASFLAAGQTRDEVVLLLAPQLKRGTLSLARVSLAGRVTTVRLAGMSGGTDALRAAQGGPVSSVRPALAVDPEGRRAFVIAADGTAAAVDLRTMRVTMHRVAQPPVRMAALKGNEEGPFRDGVWVGSGRVAIAGYDMHPGKPATPAGAQLVDTRSWTARMLDPGATAVSRVGDLLLTVATSWEEGATGTGLHGFGLDGAPRFHLLGSAPLSLAGATTSRALVQDTVSGAALLVDLRAGRVLRTVATTGLPVQPLG